MNSLRTLRFYGDYKLSNYNTIPYLRIRVLRFYIVHNPANIAEASPSFWILNSTLAVPKFFFFLNFFKDNGAPVLLVILPNILCGIIKTETNQIILH